MTIRKIVQSIYAVGLIGLFACNAQANLLTNGSFETPDASSGDSYCSDSWTCQNQVYTAAVHAERGGGDWGAPDAHAGNQSLKMFDSGGTSFAYQSVAVTAGQTYKLSARVINWAGDPFKGFGLLGLTFWDGPNGSAGGANTQLGAPFDVNVCAPGRSACVLFPLLAFELQPQVDGTDDSQWFSLTVSGTAPAGSQSASAFMQIHSLGEDPPRGDRCIGIVHRWRQSLYRPRCGCLDLVCWG
jgi:hypothetical protein